MKHGMMVRVFLVVVLMIGGWSCSKKNVPPQPGLGPGGISEGSGAGFDSRSGAGGTGLDDARWRELGLNSEAERKEFLAKAKNFENEDVYFDYDSYVLSEPAKKTLDEKVAFLKRFPKVRVTIEGHCDDRGTNEYNLALGERRANSALQYIINSGVDQTKLSIISYGEERPIVSGSDEASWAKNRRAHFVLNN
jgi:peptidoglycan-associated lipoprotein